MQRIELLELSNAVNELYQYTLHNRNITKNWLNQTDFRYQLDVLDQLSKIFHEHNNDKLRLAKHLQAFLVRNWALVKGTKLCYTACSNAQLTCLLCDIAQFVKDNINDNTLCALQILIPDLAVESDNPAYPSLNQLEIKEVLKTHIFYRAGKYNYLVPVKQFAELIEIEKTKRHNIYYDIDDYPELAILNGDEYNRLINHSPETEALFKAHMQYRLVINEQGSLLTHLNKLVEHLHFNSNQGIGSEEIAGTGTDDAIMKFKEYYDQLGDKKETIPAHVKKEINALFELASPTQKRKENPIATCISTRRKDLKQAMLPVERELAAIGLDGQCKADLILKSKQHIKDCEKELKEVMNKKDYTGNDKLPLTQSLLEALNVDISISSMADLKTFIELSADEISHFCQQESLRENLVQQFTNLERFILFIHETPLAQLQAFLTACHQEIAVQLIKKSQDIPVLLMTLHDERLWIVCESIIPKLIKYRCQFQQVYVELSTVFEHCKAFFEVMKSKLPDLIKNAYDFQYVYQVLFAVPEQRTIFFELIKFKLLELIEFRQHFVCVYQVLSAVPEQRAIFFELMQYKLPGLIKDADDFQKVYAALSSVPEHREAFFELMQSKLPELIVFLPDQQKELRDKTETFSIEPVSIIHNTSTLFTPSLSSVATSAQASVQAQNAVKCCNIL